MRHQHLSSKSLSTWSHLTVEGDIGTLRDVSTREPSEGRERWCRVERRGDGSVEERKGEDEGKAEDEDWVLV